MKAKYTLIVQKRSGVTVSCSDHDSLEAASLFWAQFFQPWVMDGGLRAVIRADWGRLYGVRDPKTDAEINKFISGDHLKENEQ